MTQVRALLLLLAVGAGAAGPAAAQTADASGRWDVRLNAPDGPHTAVLTLKRDGQKLTGTIKDDVREFRVEGSQNGAEVSLSFNYPDEGIIIRMTGTQKADSIAGPVTFGDETGDWTA